MKGGSRPISRVLSWATIHLGYTSPRTSSDLPGSECEPHPTAEAERSPIWSCSGWGLPSHEVLPLARCALTAPFHPYRRPWGRLGGLLSVALSVGSRPPGVTWHPALWSPDFPPRIVRPAAVAWPTPAANNRSYGAKIQGKSISLCNSVARL